MTYPDVYPGPGDPRPDHGRPTVNLGGFDVVAYVETSLEVVEGGPADPIVIDHPVIAVRCRVCGWQSDTAASGTGLLDLTHEATKHALRGHLRPEVDHP